MRPWGNLHDGSPLRICFLNAACPNSRTGSRRTMHATGPPEPESSRSFLRRLRAWLLCPFIFPKQAPLQFSSAFLPKDCFLLFPIGACFIAILFGHHIPLSAFNVCCKTTQNSVSSASELSKASASNRPLHRRAMKSVETLANLVNHMSRDPQTHNTSVKNDSVAFCWKYCSGISWSGSVVENMQPVAFPNRTRRLNRRPRERNRAIAGAQSGNPVFFRLAAQRAHPHARWT